MRALASLLLAGASLLTGCDELTYRCHSDANCVVQGVEGRCVSAGIDSYCAFPYRELAVGSNTPLYCPSGLRWDTSAPEEIQGSCVVLQDGGAPDGR